MATSSSTIPIIKCFSKIRRTSIKSFSYLVNAFIKIFNNNFGNSCSFETWGIKIGPVIAGLGLFGVAVALGAQDLFKNLISGILIIMEKRFQLGDVIEVPGHAIGTVEHIEFKVYFN